jgi:ubiquinone/menaquinone biosynthesis C-methylase UbiE
MKQRLVHLFVLLTASAAQGTGADPKCPTLVVAAEKTPMFANPHKVLDGFESLRRHHNAKKKMRENQLTKIPLKQGARILDIASGPGLYLAFWLEHSKEKQATFTMLDHNEAALAECNEQASLAGATARVQTVAGDIFKLGEALPGRKFDVIFIGNTLEYIEEPDKYLRENVMPLLADGGILAVRDLDCAFANCNLVDPVLNHRIVGSRIRNCQTTATFHNPFMGRNLKNIFSKAGFGQIENHADLVEFEAPLSDDVKVYLSKLHTTWYIEDMHGILSPQDIATWTNHFDLSNPQSVLHDPGFYYAEMEYLVIGRKVTP